MTRIEFIFVLISIIAGLSLTQLLTGLTRLLRSSEKKIDVAHAMFSFGLMVGAVFLRGYSSRASATGPLSADLVRTKLLRRSC